MAVAEEKKAPSTPVGKGSKQAESNTDSPSQRVDTQTKSMSDNLSSHASTDGHGEDEGSTDAIISGKVEQSGDVVNSDGEVIGRIHEGDIKKMIGMNVDQEGDVLDEEGNVIGKAEPVEGNDTLAPEGDKAAASTEKQSEDVDNAADDSKQQEAESSAEKTKEGEAPEASVETPATENKEGEAPDAGVETPTTENKEEEESKDDSKQADAGDDTPAPEDAEGAPKDDSEQPLKEVDPEEQKIDPEQEADDATEKATGDLSILKGLKPNKAGNIVNDKGKIIGRVAEGDPKKLSGRPVDASGKIWNDSGEAIGRAELVPDSDDGDKPPFADFPDNKVEKDGSVTFEGEVIGKVIEGEAKSLAGKSVDEDGEILDDVGNVVGKAERYEEPEAEPDQPADLSSLAGKKVNKGGFVVDEDGKVFGKVAEGELKRLVGKYCDKNGNILDSSGEQIGRAELVDQEQKDDSPFADFPDSIVQSDGTVKYEDKVVGRLIEGDAKKLSGKKVDQDGDVLDQSGNTIGKAERWEEEEPEAEPEADQSALAGKKVNKIGNVVDERGSLFGKVIEGDIKKLVGKMCDKKGNIWSSSGEIIGKAELLPESERETQSDGPFSGFPNNSVQKDGKVHSEKGEVIGRLTQGDGKTLAGKSVDEDGDVLDKNGNPVGKAERWEEEEKPKKDNPYEKAKLNRDGDVFNEDGNLIAKLTEGDAARCAGHEIDDDGDIVDSKKKVIGHVTPIGDIPEEKAPEESPEEAQARTEAEADKKLAKQMSNAVSTSIDKIKPILKMITEAIDKAEATPKEELDEQKLVDQVRPLIEQGSGILQEANGVIRGLDPDGRIQSNAKNKTEGREASPEEYRLAEQLKELTGSVTETIDGAKKKIAGMPHAKKELNPLWGLLAEPLGQILAAVGLLLSGVLGIVGRLLSGLGLGGLLDGLLGGLGLTKVLDGLGLGAVTSGLGLGKKKK